MDRSTDASLFLNGKAPAKELIDRYSPPSYLKICTDGAYGYLRDQGIEPDILLGDMDSVSGLPERPSFEIIRLPDVNSSDLDKALQYCSENGIGTLRIFGADGKRMDHLLVNFALLAHYAGKISLEVFTAGEYLKFLLPGDHHFPGVKSQRFSLLALRRVSGLTLKGAAFPLEDNTLESGSRGLGNRFTGAELLVRFDRGLLLYMTELNV